MLLIRRARPRFARGDPLLLRNARQIQRAPRHRLHLGPHLAKPLLGGTAEQLQLEQLAVHREPPLCPPLPAPLVAPALALPPALAPAVLVPAFPLAPPFPPAPATGGATRLPLVKPPPP